MKISYTTTSETIYRAEVVHDNRIQTFTTVAHHATSEARSIAFRAELEAMEKRAALKELRASIAKALNLPIEEVQLT